MTSPDHSRSLPIRSLHLALELEIPSDVQYIERVVDMVRRQCEQLSYSPRQISLNVPVALTEALSNAILRGNREHLAKRSVQMFPAETAQSMFDFKAEDVVGNIAPRPVLLLHSASDSVTPTEQSLEMFKRAKDPVDLCLFSDTTHFMFGAENVRVRHILKDWLDKYFPAKAKVAA